MEERTYLQKHFNSPISIGLSILDLTMPLHNSLQWSEKGFFDLLNGIFSITKKSRKDNYEFFTFLDIKSHIQLHCALESKQEVVKNQFVGALHSKKDLDFFRAIKYFTTIILFKKENEIEGLEEPLS